MLRFPTVAPGLIGNDIAYPAMLVFLPSGFAGFMVAGIFAAYRSTIETHLNWGTSYLVHDFYQRFIRPGSSQRELVFAGRLVTALLMVLGVLFTLALDNARNAFNLLLSIGAGTGLDLLAALVLVAHQRLERGQRDACVVRRLARVLRRRKARSRRRYVPSLLTTIGVTTIVWIAVTYLTPPVEMSVLAAFYAKVRPAGPGWARIRRECALPPSPDSLSLALAGLGARLGVDLRRALCDRRLRLRPHGPRRVLERVAAAAILGLLAIGRRLWCLRQARPPPRAKVHRLQ